MSLVKRFLAGLGRSGAKRPVEQALTVEIELTGGPFGSEDEVEEIRLLGDDCEAALRGRAAGAFEGEEFGESQCALCFSGPDAEALWAIVQPVVKRSRLARGGHAVLRLGGPGSKEIRRPLE